MHFCPSVYIPFVYMSQERQSLLSGPGKGAGQFESGTGTRTSNPVAGSRPSRWCMTRLASSSLDVYAAVAIAITSSGSSTGSVSALAIDSALM